MIYCFIAADFSGCGSNSSEFKASSNFNNSNASDYESMKKELAEYFTAFGIPGGPDGTMERVQIFIERAHDSTNLLREQYEDVIGRVMIALGKSLENRVEHNPARIFAGSVHKFLAACRVLEYIAALKIERVTVN